MSKLLVIGPTSKTVVINCKENVASFNDYHGDIFDFNAGSMYTLAYDLSVMDNDTYFFTRIAFDSTGNTMNYELEENGCAVFSNNRDLAITPQTVIINDKRNASSSFHNINYNTYPDLSDGFPPIDFDENDYAIINVKNSIYFQKLIEHYPNLHFVSYNTVISDALLNNIEGVIFDYKTISNITSKQNFQSYAKSLFNKGVKWVVVTNDGLESYCYQASGQSVLMMDDVGNYPLGTNEAFASMLIACLSVKMNLKEAVEHGLKLANNFSYINDIRLEKKYFEKQG